MRKGITLVGSSNAVESPTRERPGAFGTTPSNNKASNVVHLDESKKDFTLNQGFSLNKGRQESPGSIYTRSSFSGGSSSRRYSESESNSHEVASQESEYTDPYIRSITSSQPNPESDLQISRISQNCFDFEEVATPFNEIYNIEDMLLVITDVLRALRRVHSAGRIYRDISIGNVYLYKYRETQEKRGMIWNLEYVKEAGVGSQNDIRTGTPDFMPVEVANQQYLYNRRSLDIDTDVDIDSDDDEQEVADRNKEPKTVYYNYVHDLESVWWIAVWALFNFEKEKKYIGSDEIDSWDAGQRELNKHKVFSGIVRNMDRFDFFLEPYYYEIAIKWVPTYFEDFVFRLDLLSRATRRFYLKKVLKKINRIVWDESFTIHETFIRLLRRVEMEEFVLVRIPEIDVKISYTLRINDG